MVHLALAGFALRFRHVPEVQPINSTLPPKKKNGFPSRGGFGGSCVLGRDLKEIEHPTEAPNGSVPQNICSTGNFLLAGWFGNWWFVLVRKLCLGSRQLKSRVTEGPSVGVGACWVNFWWVSSAGLSEPPPFTVYSVMWPIIDPILVTFEQIRNFRYPGT